MNSIIEAQIALTEEQLKEIEKCKASPYYFYKNYMVTNGVRTQTGLSEKEFNKRFREIKDGREVMMKTKPLEQDSIYHYLKSESLTVHWPAVPFLIKDYKHE